MIFIMRNFREEILKYFPVNIYKNINETIKENAKYENEIEEIRIRVNNPIILKIGQFEKILEYKVSSNELIQILEKLCENSIYAYKNQMCEGYITINGGHRVGIVGSVVIEQERIVNIKYISSLNFRIAREIIDCSQKVLNQIIDIQNLNIFNTIIVAPPGCGKTTVLRDVIRKISNGIPEISFKGRTIGVVDERGEIAAMYKGVPQNDIGIRTDVIENISKSKGMKVLLRSMTPQIIACDEIGTSEDVKAIKEILTCGVKGIFTMHGRTIEDIRNKRELYDLVQNRQIEKIVFL